MGQRDPRVDDYIERAAAFAQPILRQLRETVHAASPDIEESIKWGAPYFLYRGMLCGMAAFTAHCTFGFWKGALVLGDSAEPASGAMGQFGRLRRVEDLPPRETLIHAAMRLNASGTATPRRTRAPQPRESTVPDALRRALDRHPAAAEHFAAMSPSHRREYIEWITEAKREETRERRIATTIEWLSEGKGRNWRYERPSRPTR